LRRSVKDGSLERVAKDRNSPEQDIHLAFANRRGVLPTVHTLIELCGGRNANSVDGT
jgi:hypothetical protein